MASGPVGFMVMEQEASEAKPHTWRWRQVVMKENFNWYEFQAVIRENFNWYGFQAVIRENFKGG